MELESNNVIKFDEDPKGGTQQTEGSRMIRWMVNKKIARDTTHASYVLLGVSIVAVIVSVILLLLTKSGAGEITPQQQQQLQLIEQQMSNR